MQGRSAEGVKWLDYSPDQWAQKNPFKAHVWWHAALFFLAQGEYDRALHLYDHELCSVNSETYVDVSNQAALLKRLEMGGVDVASTTTCCPSEMLTSVSRLPRMETSMWHGAT
jgi:hypothetical protein